MNYYNEFDPFAAQWLRELIKDGLIPDGYVDDRSILEVTADDLKGYTQHHFFAGIGGWSRALQLAGWPATRPVCTASLPCQPFSVAGQQLGKDDERHLLPHFMELVRDFQFDTIMGEQVEGAVRHGWLDDLHTEMEAEGYATGAVVLGAHSVNAPHKRQRLYWVADTNYKGSQRYGGFEWEHDQKGWQEQVRHCTESRINNSTLGNTEHDGSLGFQRGSGNVQPSEKRGQEEPQLPRQSQGASRSSEPADLSGCKDGRGQWDSPDFVFCKDGKYRPIPTESSLQPVFPDGFSDRLGACQQPDIVEEAIKGFPLIGKGFPNRQGVLRGAGNAIVPQAAAEVIKAFMETA